MKKTFIILSAFLLILTGCDKRDLSSIETRLDNLENSMDNANGRITEIEASIAQINKDIESLQYLKGGLVINNVSGSDAAGWKITFANGKVVTVYPKDASTIVPVITVSDDNYWTVDYGDGSGPQYLKDSEGNRIPATSAPGDPGKDGVTPVLGADAQGYWIVSYDEGETFSRLLDDKGNPVKAVVSAGDSIFSSVVSDGQKATFTLKNGTVFSCPIVSEFLCIIKDAEGTVEFNAGETKSFELEMKGISNAIALCPEGWRAALDENALKVTAPGATKSSISFDSSSSVRILATSTQGYAVIAGFNVSIFVPTPEYDTYFEDWSNNGFITINGQKILREDYGDGTLLNAGDVISTAGAYFVSEGATVTFATSWGEKLKANTIIIGNSKKSRSELDITGVQSGIYLSDGNNYVFKNMVLKMVESTQPVFNGNAAYTIPMFILDDCRVLANSNAFCFTNAKLNFGILNVTGCDFRIIQDNSYLGTLGTVGKMLIDNCIFYSKDAAIYIVQPLCGTDNCLDITFTNNTMVNLTRSNNGIVVGSIPNESKDTFVPVIANNLRYFCTAAAAGNHAVGHWTLVSAEGGGTWYSWNTEGVTSDYVFVDGTGSSVFRALLNPAVASTMLQTSPFSSIDYTTGTFVNTTSYGAKR